MPLHHRCLRSRGSRFLSPILYRLVPFHSWSVWSEQISALSSGFLPVLALVFLWFSEMLSCFRCVAFIFTLPFYVGGLHRVFCPNTSGIKSVAAKYKRSVHCNVFHILFFLSHWLCVCLFHCEHKYQQRERESRGKRHENNLKMENMAVVLIINMWYVTKSFILPQSYMYLHE